MVTFLIFSVVIVALAFSAKPLKTKYLEYDGRRWEKKLLKGMHEQELIEIEKSWDHTDDEIREAEVELEKEMNEW